MVAPTKHVPSIAKHPSEISKPLASVEVPVPVPVKVSALTLPVNVPFVPEKLEPLMITSSIVPPDIAGLVIVTFANLSILFVPAI